MPFLEEIAGEKSYSLRELAVILGVHYRTVCGWVGSGRLATFSLGRRRLVRLSEVQRFCGISGAVAAPHVHHGKPMDATSVLASVRAKYRL